MQYKVSKGTPMDLKKDPKNKFPFDKIKVGHYFDVPANDVNAKRNSGGGNRTASACYRYMKKNPDVKFQTVRLASGAVRVYRVPV